MQVLVVDDEVSIRELLSFNLKKNAYDVLEAADGRQALKMVQEEKPDLLLLDLMLPEMDGLEVCRRLKQHPATADIPV